MKNEENSERINKITSKKKSTINEDFISLYPVFISQEEGHPTSEKFMVVKTGDIRGRGLKGKVAFKKGEFVAKLSGIIVNHTTLDTIQITPTLYFADAWFSRFLLHSCEPNVEINIETLEVKALRGIEQNEYLTIDYAYTDDTVTSQFACNCGAEKCKKWITGKNEKINKDGIKHLKNIK